MSRAAPSVKLSGACDALRVTMLCRSLAIVALGAAIAIPLGPEVLAAADPKVLARVLEPGPRSLVYGPTTVTLEIPPGTEAEVEREIGPGRFVPVAPDSSGRRVFDAGLDLGPERLRVRTYEVGETGERRLLGETLVDTAYFPPTLAEVRPDPAVEIAARPAGTGGFVPTSHLEPARFTCRYAGEVCAVQEVDPLTRGSVFVSLLIDTSGSMCPYVRELAASIDALAEAVAVPELSLRFRVVEFSDSRRARLDPLAELGWSRERDLFRYDDDVGRVRGLIETLACGGSTSLWEAIERELNDIDLVRGERRLAGVPAGFALVVLSDGQNTSGSVDYGWISSVAAETGVPVFPVLVGAGRRAGADSRLASLGAQSGGRAYRDPRGIRAALSDIGAALSSRHRVVFRPQSAINRAQGAQSLELGYPGIEITHPAMWAPDASRLALARQLLRSAPGDTSVLSPAIDSVRRLGDARDGEAAFERFRALLDEYGERLSIEVPKDASLEDRERALGLDGDRAYLGFRSRVFYAVFATIARALLHETDDRREQRRGARLLAEVDAFVESRRYSVDHVMAPVVSAYFDPDFPSDAKARTDLAAFATRDRVRARAAGMFGASSGAALQ